MARVDNQGRTLKLVLTTHVFLPDYSSGTEILTLHTAKELQRLGHEVEICTGFMAHPGLPDSERFDTYQYAGLKVNRFLHCVEPMGEQSNVVEAEYNNLLFARWFRGYLSRFKPDLVHFFHLGLLSASAIDACSELDVPMVMTPTDFWLICPNGQLRLPDNSLCTGPEPDSVNCIKHAVSNQQPSYVSWAFWKVPASLVSTMTRALEQGFLSRSWFSPMVLALQRRAEFLRQRMNRLDRVIVPTHLMEQMLVNNGLRPEKVVFSRFGINPICAPAEVYSDEVGGALRVGFIGGLSPHKGAHVLVSAVRSQLNDLPVELRIYGNPTVKPEYSKELVDLADGDSRIQFCGTFPNEIIGEIFSGLDVLVVPSLWYENTPLVIYSAQAAGCPVIASNVGGMSEVVEHEKNGLLFEVGNVRALADAIRRIASDRKLLRDLASNAQPPKSIMNYVAELQNIYFQVVEERGGSV